MNKLVLRAAAIVAIVASLQACVGATGVHPWETPPLAVEVALPTLQIVQPEPGADYRHDYAGPSLEPPSPVRPQRDSIAFCSYRPYEPFDLAATPTWALMAVSTGPRRFEIDRGEVRWVYYHMAYAAPEPGRR